MRARDPQTGAPLQPLTEQRVTIRFVCSRGHGPVVVGEFSLDTFDGADDEVKIHKLEDGTLPQDATSPTPKALLMCPRCGHESQKAGDKIRAALESLIGSARRVANYEI